MPPPARPADLLSARLPPPPDDGRGVGPPRHALVSAPAAKGITPATSPDDVSALLDLIALPPTTPDVPSVPTSSEVAHLRAEVARMCSVINASALEIECERAAHATALASSSAAAQLVLVQSLLAPIDNLERLVSYEECRPDQENSNVRALAAAATRFHRALEEHGVESICPSPGDAFDGSTHEVASLRVHGRSPRSREQLPNQPMVVSEMVRSGMLHTPTNTVLRCAVVTTEPASEWPQIAAAAGLATDAACAADSGAADSGAANCSAANDDSAARAGSGSDGAGGGGGGGGDGGEAGGGGSSGAGATSDPADATEAPQYHRVQPSDTLQGIALKYGVRPQMLIRVNRLPGAHALHSRRSLKIPPTTASGEGGREAGRRSFAASDGGDDEMVLFGLAHHHRTTSGSGMGRSARGRTGARAPSSGWSLGSIAARLLGTGQQARGPMGLTSFFGGPSTLGSPARGSSTRPAAVVSSMGAASLVRPSGGHASGGMRAAVDDDGDEGWRGL